MNNYLVSKAVNTISIADKHFSEMVKMIVWVFFVWVSFRMFVFERKEEKKKESKKEGKKEMNIYLMKGNNR